MKRTLPTLALCAAFFSACGSDGDSKPDTATTSTRATPGVDRSVAKIEGGVSIKVMSSRYGRVLFDGKGRALYLFTRDRTSRSRCYGECASAWPPFFTNGKPRALSGASSKRVGTTKRRDEKTQVTYAGDPLYYYEGDRKPGQILCQDVAEFGGTWRVVTPSGRAVR